MAIEKHVFAGITFPGRQEVKKIATELERQRNARKDAVVRSDRMKLVFLDKQLLLKVPYREESKLVPMTPNAWGHMLNWMGLEKRSGYYKWLLHGARNPRVDRSKADPMVHWENACNVINDFFNTEKEYRLVRLMSTESNESGYSTEFCRAFLSDKYKIVSNADFFEAIVDKLLDVEAEIWHARLSEDKFMVYAVAPGLAAQVNTEREFDPGDGWKSRWYGKEGDVYNAALSAWNSETGSGGYGIAQAILRRVCANYCVWQDIVAKSHVGRRRGEEILLSDETIKKENEVFFLKIRDYVVNTFDPDEFQKIVDVINGAAQDPVPPEEAERVAEALRLTYTLSDERAARIKQLFYSSGDYSRCGLSNAVTEAGHDDIDPDEGAELERIGSTVMCMSVKELVDKGNRIKKEKGEKREMALSVGNAEFGDD